MTLEESRYYSLIIIGGIILVAGILILVFASKKVNSVFGYRTPSSMKSPERYYFAQLYSGRLMIFMGLITILFSIYGYLFLPDLMSNKYAITIFSVAQAALIIALTEIAIRKKFKNE